MRIMSQNGCVSVELDVAVLELDEGLILAHVGEKTYCMARYRSGDAAKDQWCMLHKMCLNMHSGQYYQFAKDRD